MYFFKVMVPASDLVRQAEGVVQKWFWSAWSDDNTLCSRDASAVLVLGETGN